MSLFSQYKFTPNSTPFSLPLYCDYNYGSGYVLKSNPVVETFRYSKNVINFPLAMNQQGGEPFWQVTGKSQHLHVLLKAAR